MGLASVVILSLIVVGISQSPALRSDPIATSVGLLCLVGIVGLTYGKWLDIRSKQAMLHLDQANYGGRN